MFSKAKGVPAALWLPTVPPLDTLHRDTWLNHFPSGSWKPRPIPTPAAWTIMLSIQCLPLRLAWGILHDPHPLSGFQYPWWVFFPHFRLSPLETRLASGVPPNDLCAEYFKYFKYFKIGVFRSILSYQLTSRKWRLLELKHPIQQLFKNNCAELGGGRGGDLDFKELEFTEVRQSQNNDN